MPHCTLNFLLCGNQPLSAPGQLISFQPAFLGSPRVPSALLALFFVATNHFWSLANSFHFTLLPKNLYFLDPPGCPVPFWHSSLWQTTTFGPLPSHCGSPCFPKNLCFLAPPGFPVPSWHFSLLWQPTTFGPWPTLFVSPYFTKNLCFLAPLG